MENFFCIKISLHLSADADLRGVFSIWWYQMTTMIQLNVRNVKKVIGGGFNDLLVLVPQVGSVVHPASRQNIKRWQQRNNCSD